MREIRSGFTLIELLVVIGIMGLLGTISVGGYQAMQRGMAERGVMENVNHFINAAYERAQIDRQPTAVYFWNETLRKGDDYTADIVVGRAVAIRRSGRVSYTDGTYIYDEFADLEKSYMKDDTTGDDVSDGAGDPKGNTMYLYPIDGLTDIQSDSDLDRTIVYQKVFKRLLQPLYLGGKNGKLADDNDNGGSGENVTTYAFKRADGDTGSVTWKAGMAYGCEFAHLELPHGYIFGSTYSANVENPVKPQGTLVFGVGTSTGKGVEGTSAIKNRNGRIQVSSLRPGSNGEVSAQPVGQSTSPTED